MSRVGDNARDLHEDALQWRPRRARSALHAAHAAADNRLVKLQDLAALTGTCSLLHQDPRDLAARIGGMAQMANREDHPQTSTWEQILAVALAGWCAASRSEELDVTSGSEAA